MATEGRDVEPGSAAEQALEQALDAAQLRTGDGQGTTIASVGEERQPSAAEAGDATAAFDE